MKKLKTKMICMCLIVCSLFSCIGISSFATDKNKNNTKIKDMIDCCMELVEKSKFHYCQKSYKNCGILGDGVETIGRKFFTSIGEMNQLINKGDAVGFDCSSLTWSLIYTFLGVDIAGNSHINGGNEYRSSHFIHQNGEKNAIETVKLDSNDYSNVLPGDVLWRQGHVAIYLGTMEFVGNSGKIETIDVAIDNGGAGKQGSSGSKECTYGNNEYIGAYLRELKVGDFEVSYRFSNGETQKPIQGYTLLKGVNDHLHKCKKISKVKSSNDVGTIVGIDTFMDILERKVEVKSINNSEVANMVSLDEIYSRSALSQKDVEEAVIEEFVMKAEYENRIMVHVKNEELDETVTLAKYLEGVLHGECGDIIRKEMENATFEESKDKLNEFFKALTVAAKTYLFSAKNNMKVLSTLQNNQYSIVTIEAIAGGSSFQAYKPVNSENFKLRSEYEIYYAKIIESVKGQVIMHKGTPIVAYHFDSSAGYTKDGNEPYLKSVKVSEDVNYVTLSASVSKQSFIEMLRKEGLYLDFTLSDIVFARNELFEITDIIIKDKVLTDNEREKFITVLQKGLYSFEGDMQSSSKRLTISIDYENENNYIVARIGNGHLSGMSHHGAREMSKNGKTCGEILHYFYSNVKISNEGVIIEPGPKNIEKVPEPKDKVSFYKKSK